MADLGSGAIERQRRSRWWVVAAALLLIACACLVMGLRGHRHPLAGPVPQHAASSANKSVAASALAPAVARSTPVSLSIPAIGVAVSLSALGLNADGTVQVPTDYQQPGWFQPGPSPGQIGSAVILGHVDSTQGPAVFFQLRTLHAGDQVDVALVDGVVAHFVVTTVVQYLKQQFPAQQVYGSQGNSALQLVTCGGTFDPQTGSYLSNVVAYTTLVGTTAPAVPPAVAAAEGVAASTAAAAAGLA